MRRGAAAASGWVLVACRWPQHACRGACTHTHWCGTPSTALHLCRAARPQFTHGFPHPLPHFIEHAAEGINGYLRVTADAASLKLEAVGLRRAEAAAQGSGQSAGSPGSGTADDQPRRPVERFTMDCVDLVRDE